MSSNELTVGPNSSEDKNTVESTAKKINQCQICTKYFATIQNLKSHIQAVHENIKAFQCQICLNHLAIPAI